MRTFSYKYVAPAETVAETVTALLEASAEHSFAALAGENGLVQIHRSALWGDIGCIFMRDRIVTDRKTCSSLPHAREWLEGMVPRLGTLRGGERP